MAHGSFRVRFRGWSHHFSLLYPSLQQSSQKLTAFFYQETTTMPAATHRVHVYGDSVNTDVIFPGKYTFTLRTKE
jgi:hypothetical protein